MVLATQMVFAWIDYHLVGDISDLEWEPLPCTGDRPGPDTPNNLCYPSIDDSVYSIGSLYIGLGRGFTITG